MFTDRKRSVGAGPLRDDGPTMTTTEPRVATDRMVTWRFIAVTLAGLAYFTGFTLLYPVLPRFIEDELGGGGTAVGLSVGAFGITAALLRPTAGRLGDRYGRRVLVLAGMAIVAASMTGYLIVDSVAAAIGLRLLFGVGEAFAFVGLATAIQDFAPDERRGEAANYFSFSVYLGIAAGPAAGEWLLGEDNFDRVWILAAGLVALGLVLGIATPNTRGDGVSQTSGWILPTAVLPGLALTGAMVGYAGFVSFVTLHAEAVGFDSAGWVFITYAVLIMAARLFAATVPDRYGPMRVATVSLTLIGLGLVVTGALDSRVGLLVGIVIFSAGMSMNFPSLMAYIVNRSDPSDRAFAVASLSIFFDVGFAIGATAVGFVVGLADEGIAFVMAGLAALAGILPLRMAAARDRRLSIG